MRICLFTSSFLPKLGGAEFAVHYLANALSDLNHKVYVFAPKSRKPNLELERKYTLHRYQLPRGETRLGFKIPFFEYLLIKEKFRTKFDILHAHFTYPPGYAAVKAKKFIKTPVVITAHGQDIQKIPSLGYGIRLDKRIEKKVKTAVMNADAMVSEGASLTKEMLNLGVSENKITHIPTGVNIARFEKQEVNIRKKYGIPDKDIIILSVGRHHKKKGYERALEVVKELTQKYPHIKYIIAGRETEKLGEQIRQMDLINHVIIKSGVSGKELDSLYLASNLFISTSFVEGFAAVFLEALAAGLPIIAMEAPGVVDIVTSGKNGFLVDSLDKMREKIEYIIKNKKIRERFSSDSCETSKQYDWKIMAQKHLELYESLLKKY